MKLRDLEVAKHILKCYEEDPEVVKKDTFMWPCVSFGTDCICSDYNMKNDVNHCGDEYCTVYSDFKSKSSMDLVIWAKALLREVEQPKDVKLPKGKWSLV